MSKCVPIPRVKRLLQPLGKSALSQDYLKSEFTGMKEKDYNNNDDEDLYNNELDKPIKSKIKRLPKEEIGILFYI